MSPNFARLVLKSPITKKPSKRRELIVNRVGVGYIGVDIQRSFVFGP